MQKPRGRSTPRTLLLILGCVLLSILRLSDVRAETSQHPKKHEPSSPGAVHITMEELHEHGGVPPGWKFTLPMGDAAAGREVFIAMSCYTCHDVAGEEFSGAKRDIGEVGPDLTGMGPLHPAEYFAETILNPNAVIVLGEGYTGTDGLSHMPEYNQILTVAQLIDLVALATRVAVQ